jgi:hypothetical protein
MALFHATVATPPPNWQNVHEISGLTLDENRLHPSNHKIIEGIALATKA